MSKDATIERLYILDGVIAQVDDASIYFSGVNVGRPMTLNCNAYLIRHQNAWMLWDTGTQDDLIDGPEGRVIAHSIRGTVSKNIAAQLAEINVAPDDIAKLALSHAHYDHVGNCRLFRSAEWIVHTAEYDTMFGADPDEYGVRSELCDSLRDNKATLFGGDGDVFGDGAVKIISTPGHCSLLLNLPQTGKVLLTVARNTVPF